MRYMYVSYVMCGSYASFTGISKRQANWEYCNNYSFAVRMCRRIPVFQLLMVMPVLQEFQFRLAQGRSVPFYPKKYLQKLAIRRILVVYFFSTLPLKLVRYKV